MALIRGAILALCCLPTTAWAADRVPIAVMDLAARGVDDAAAGALTTEVSNTLAQLRVFRVITREDIQRMLQLEQTKQQCTGGADASCMAEIGGALGVDYLIYGEVSKIADTFNISVVLLDISKAEAANRVSRRVTDPRRLLEEIEDATKLLVQPLLAGKKGYLVLDVREAGAKVSVDGRLMGVTPIGGRMELPMGAHEVLVEKEGFLVWARTVDVPPNQATVEAVSLVPSQDYLTEYESSARLTRTFAWVTAATGAALIGTGVVLRLVGDARFDDLSSKGYLTQQASICAATNPGYDGRSFCPTPAGYENDVLGTIESIERGDTIALATLVGGAVSAAVSAVLFLSGDDPSRYSVHGTTVSATLGPNGAGLKLSW